MTSKNSQAKIADMISRSDFCVSYCSYETEVDPQCIPFVLPDNKAVVSRGLSRDPVDFGKEMTKRFLGLSGFVLVPGKKFDRFGGRCGRGWGWYDRFLSTVPVHWMRIGICKKGSFFETSLVLQKWDEPVDWVIVADEESFLIYETHARSVLSSISPSLK